MILARAERGTIQVHTEPVLLQHVLPKVCDEEQRRWPDNRFKLTTAPRVPVARRMRPSSNRSCETYLRTRPSTVRLTAWWS